VDETKFVRWTVTYSSCKATHQQPVNPSRRIMGEPPLWYRQAISQAAVVLQTCCMAGGIPGQRENRKWPFQTAAHFVRNWVSKRKNYLILLTGYFFPKPPKRKCGLGNTSCLIASAHLPTAVKCQLPPRSLCRVLSFLWLVPIPVHASRFSARAIVRVMDEAINDRSKVFRDAHNQLTRRKLIRS
jgi:hypothetical protein